jgi:hypothetical protein
MATKIYYNPESAITFKSSGGSALFTIKALGSGAGRQATIYDRGAGAKPALAKVEVMMKYSTSPALSAVTRVYLYAAENAPTHIDNGSVDTAIATETLISSNFGNPIGQNVANAALIGPFYSSHIVAILGRYVAVALWNATAVIVDGTDNTSDVIVTFMPDESQ